jgi:hypothetical protein
MAVDSKHAIKKGKFGLNNSCMGAAKPLVNEITYYLTQLNSEQQKAVLTVVKTFAKEGDNRWSDKDFVTEMDRRFAEIEKGNVKTTILDELEEGARKAHKNRKQRKR